MVHNLDITNGIASFASANIPAWHTLGTVVEKPNGELMTAREALVAGNAANWNVRKVPAYVNVDGQEIAIPGCNGVVRDNPVVKGQIDSLGFVGNAFRIFQNEESCDLLDAIVDESGANYETVGGLEGGKKFFVTMKLPGHMMIGGVDQVDNYLAAINAHDGSMAFTFMVTPVRIVCQNTLNMAFSDHKTIFRARHTSGAERIIREQARTALDLTFSYLDDFNAEAEKLIQTKMTQSQFEEIIARNFGAPKDAAQATITRAETKLDEMASLFSDAFTQDGVRESAWAGLNALTEWYDHHSGARAGAVGDADTSRAFNAIFYPEFKEKARKLILAEAGIS